MSLLDVSDLQVTFDTPRGSVKALDGVNFSIDQGETLAIVGESGSGKSVTVRSIMSLLPSTATITGNARFEDVDLFDIPPLRAKHLFGVDIAMIFQDPMTSLNPVKRIGAQLTEAMRYHLDVSKEESRERAVELMTQVGIPSPKQRLRQYPHELSGGMRQRVVIAMALACEPKLLIADEPTTALDVTVQKHVLDLLSELQRERNMAMILITHDLGVASGRADNVAVMYAGRIMEKASSERLFSNMRHPYTEALLETIPSIANPSHTRLSPIPGRPPNLLDLPKGCRYSARCRYVTEQCLESSPPLEELAVDDGHVVACFNRANTPEGEAARAANEAAQVTVAGVDLDSTMEVI